MKASLAILFAVVATYLLVGCHGKKSKQPLNEAKRGQRLVKVSFREQAGEFRFRINQQPVQRLPNSDFTNAMTTLRLDYGDIVVWEAERDSSGKELSEPDGISRWWFGYLKEMRASFYSLNSDSTPDFFATPFFHWKAPPEKPRHLADATFLLDGANLGQGRDGFQQMLQTIDSQKSGPVLILAPRIKNEGQESLDQLETWAGEAGSQQRMEKILVSRFRELTDFTTLMDKD